MGRILVFGTKYISSILVSAIMPQLEIINYLSLLSWFFITFIPTYLLFKEYFLLYIHDWIIIINNTK